VHENFYKKLKH